jgi:hypothetical protein
MEETEETKTAFLPEIHPGDSNSFSKTIDYLIFIKDNTDITFG